MRISRLSKICCKSSTKAPALVASAIWTAQTARQKQGKQNNSYVVRFVPMIRAGLREYIKLNSHLITIPPRSHLRAKRGLARREITTLWCFFGHLET